MTRAEAKQLILEACGAGWLPLVDRAFDSLPAGVTITETFQKYGRLTFRIDPHGHSYEQFLDEINWESANICEICGAVGSEKIVDGWITALCDLHTPSGDFSC